MQFRKGMSIVALVAGLLMQTALMAQTAQTAPTTKTAQPVGALRVESAWARPTVAGQASGGGYVTITGGTVADRLVSASAPVAASVELHTMAMEGDVMRMRQIAAVEVPADASVAFKPGGKHLMFIGLKQPLKAGSRFPLTLRFEKAGEVTVQAQVTMQPPEAHKH